METKRMTGPWELEETRPFDPALPGQLPRWAIYTEDFPDTRGVTGTGIVTYSRDTFAYLSACEDVARLIASAPSLLAENERLRAALIRAERSLSEVLAICAPIRDTMMDNAEAGHDYFGSDATARFYKMVMLLESETAPQVEARAALARAEEGKP